LNILIQSLIKEIVRIEVSGKKLINGTVIDLGSDMVVLFNGIDFVYIPLVHIQNFEIDRNNENDIIAPKEFPSIITEEKNEELTFREVLTQAKGKYVEIYITGVQPLHGCIISIMDDYLVFHSPIYKTMYIALSHLKWLIPYTRNEKPYGVDANTSSFPADDKSFENNFENQVKKFENNIVVFNIGGNKNYIGKINKVEKEIVEIQRARKDPVYVNVFHIKTLSQL